MRNIPHILFSVVLSTALVACSTGNDRNQRGSTMGGQQNAGNNTARTGSSAGTNTGQQGQRNVTMSCLQNMDQSSWRDLGLNNDQMNRVQQLQQRSNGQHGTQSGGQGGQRTGGTQGGTNTGTQGTGTTGGNTGNTHGTTSGGTATDQNMQRDLNDILTSEQMAQLGRRCDNEMNRGR